MTAIMVVDDHPTNRRIIAKLADSLEQDVEVVTFADPLQALAYVEANIPDLLITDYKMTPIDGDELIRRFRRMPACAQVPALVITAYQDVEFQHRAIEAGSTDFVLSPIDHHDFRQRSRRLLALGRHRKSELHPTEALERWSDRELAEKTAANEGIEMLSELLRTVNDHLAAKLVELDNAHSDLQNLAEISQIAAVLIDGALRIRRFTPLLKSIYFLSDSDTGRPLTTIPARIEYPHLERDFKRMIESEDTVERCVTARQGKRRYRMRMMPYRLKDGLIDGAALAFTAIDA